MNKVTTGQDIVEEVMTDEMTAQRRFIIHSNSARLFHIISHLVKSHKQ